MTNDGPTRKNSDDAFSRFDTKHACDRQTDRQRELAWHIRAKAYMRLCVKSIQPGKIPLQQSLKVFLEVSRDYVLTQLNLQIAATVACVLVHYLDTYTLCLL